MNRHAGRLAAAAVCLLALASAATAQNVYRIVGKDGRVLFSDRPATDAPSTLVSGHGGGTSSSLAGLPLEVRNAASKYPVTLYSSPRCAPCGAARSALQARGVPYTERSVTTPADVEALKRIAGEDVSLPYLTLGAQHMAGFSDVELKQYLDAAGYPASSQLPATYVHAEATPLTTPSTPVPGAAQAQASAPAVTVVPAPRRGAAPASNDDAARAAPDSAAARAPGLRF